METKKCPQCKTEIAKDAKKCPQCHADIRNWFRRHYILTNLGILVILVITLSSIDSNKSSDSAKNTEKNNLSEPDTSESYQQIFTFSGNGIKKSESFNITGDKFKVSYDCKGDPSATLCTAFVYKVGSVFPQGIMNSSKPIKDETIIYTSMAGKGEYYLDANTMGDFTMTVYEYK